MDNALMFAMKDLQESGYTFHFIKNRDYFFCCETKMNFKGHELNITEMFRYENKNDPGKNGVIYAIESAEYGLKGVLVN